MKIELIMVITAFICIVSFFNIYAPSDEPYEKIIKEFAATHTYNITEYNCVNYSNDLVQVLTDAGYNASTKIVNNRTHMIIQLHLDIEPQTAKIINNVRGLKKDEKESFKGFNRGSL